MAEHTPEVEAHLRKAFSDHPEEVRAAQAACHASGLNVTGVSHG